MTTALSIWENEGLGDILDDIIKEDDNLDLVLSQIPGMFGDSEKATYLGFRALGMRPNQAMELLGLDMETLDLWYTVTPNFREFETKCLRELQSSINANIIRLQFMRNMTMFMFRDSLTIRKGLTDMEGMSPREFDYLKSVRRFYSNNDFLALEKAIAPEKHRNNTLVLSFGGNAFEVVDENDGQGAQMHEVIDVGET